MTKELAKTTASALVPMDNSAWGEGEMSSNDIVIPKISLMQPMSTPVTEAVAKFGDFVSNIDNSVVGDIDKGFEFIPFYMTKFHYVNKLKNGEFKFDRAEPCLTLADENKAWEDADQDGTPIKRVLVRQFYGLIPSTNTPVVLQAKGSSAMFGKKIATQMYMMNKASSLPPCGMTLLIKGKKESNAKGKYAVMDFSLARKTTAQEIETCLQWFNTVRGGEAIVQEDEQTKFAF